VVGSEKGCAQNRTSERTLAELRRAVGEVVEAGGWTQRGMEKVEFEDGAMLEAMEEERLWSIHERAQLEVGREEEEPVCRGFVAERGVHVSRSGSGFEWKRDTESVESSSGGEAGCVSEKFL